MVFSFKEVQNGGDAVPCQSGDVWRPRQADLMTWDATTNMELIDQPLLMIAGSKADTKYMTDEAFQKATKAKDKTLFVIAGATHIETYWKPEYVKQAVTKLNDFFKDNL